MYYTSREVYEFISKQTKDPIVEWKICTISGQSFPIYQSDLDLYAKISPTFAGQRFMIPTPTLCPEERQRRRLAFRNERKLYKRKCDFSGQDMVSMYAPSSHSPLIRGDGEARGVKAYDQKVRRSDARDAMSYGRAFDFSQSFTQNFASLYLDVPKCAINNDNSVNSDYCNPSQDNKDCYLCHGAAGDENCLYCVGVEKCDYCVDGLSLFESEWSYNCVDDHLGHNNTSCFNTHGCSNCISVKNATGCHDCMFSVWLSNKSYMICNTQYTKEDYLTRKESIIYDPATYQEYTVSYQELLNQTNEVCMHIEKSENAIGDYINNSKNVLFSYDVNNSEEVKYTRSARNQAESCYDVSYHKNSSLQLESASVVTQHNTPFTMFCRDSQSTYYSSDCHYVIDCFGCVWLRHKQYCIFNKQYTKEDYELTVAKIIAHMIETNERGEFFHPSLSPFGYNETIAHEYFPLTPDSPLIKKGQGGFSRSDYNSDVVIPAWAEVIDRKTNPDIAWLTDEQLLSKIHICEITNRPYRLVKPELEFYRKRHLPIPRRHPEQRHADRMALRPPRELHLRTCDKTGKEIISVYPQDVTFKVYGEEAYQQEVFG